MGKRILLIFICFIFGMSCIITKIYTITSGIEFKKASQMQSSYTLDIDTSRAYIYDKNLIPMVNTSYSYKAAVIPSPEVAIALLDDKIIKDKDTVLKKLNEHLPFTTEIKTDQIYSTGIETYKIINRYSQKTFAPHIIGHLNSENEGIMGAELAFNNYLEAYKGSLKLNFAINAAGDYLQGEQPDLINNGYNDKHGVVLTIDTDIQRIVEFATKNKIQKGAIVVMDVNTGNILASQSLPIFSPNDVSAYLDDENKPFYNRAFGATSIGSTFKILVTACALEKGIPLSQEFICNGFEEIDGIKLHCQNKFGHGKLNMTEAFKCSCNPYFINLAKKTGVCNIALKAGKIGFGKSYEIMPNQFTAKGYLPPISQLENDKIESANFSFGQGKILASPIQISQLVSIIANGGLYVEPRLIEGFTNDGININEHTPFKASERIFSENVAETVKDLMVQVIESGSDKKAQPLENGAGGKTGSAQTGIIEIDGEEKVEAWFTGFYPAENPKYAITILAEGEESGGNVCAPIFKEICDNLYLIK